MILFSDLECPHGLHRNFTIKTLIAKALLKGSCQIIKWCSIKYIATCLLIIDIIKAFT